MRKYHRSGLIDAHRASEPPRTPQREIFLSYYSVATRFAKAMALSTGQTTVVVRQGDGWGVTYQERPKPRLIGGLVTAEYYKRRMDELGLPFDGYFGRKPDENDGYYDVPGYLMESGRYRIE